MNFKKHNHILHQTDPEIAQWIDKELQRQRDGLEMIASENYTSLAVMQAQGSVLTNKYAEGYPGKRYYGGCKYVDHCENIAIDRVKKLFSVKHANVQAHSGSQANMAIYLSELKPGDKIMGLDLAHGGHLTHGSSVNFSGLLFESVSYYLNLKTQRLDFNLIEDQLKKQKPKLLIAGYSAYSRKIDFKTFKDLAKQTGACFVVDMSHIAGLIAGGQHPSPIPYADYTSSTTHKTLRGPRGGIILCEDADKAKKINSRIFPGIQGGPLEHVIAAKAIAFLEASQESFKSYAKQIIQNAKSLESTFHNEGIQMVSGGTDNHLLLLDLSQRNITGKQAEQALELAGITVNKNTIPEEKRSPFITSGIRLGTPALTSRNMKTKEMTLIATWISQVIKDPKNESLILKISQQVKDLVKQFPLYENQ